jgi:peroxin-14
MIAPPTAPQLEQDKKAIDESFERAFSLLEQLAKDTEALKNSDQARTERLDSALADVESVVSELKTASQRREEDMKNINDDVRRIKDLIPKAMEGQRESTDNRLKELNTELKSLKTLMGQRMNPPPASSTSPYTRATSAGISSPTSLTPANINGAASGDAVTPKPASVSSGVGLESIPSLQGRSGSPFNAGTPPGRAAIPAWQMAAASKSTTSGQTPASGSSSQEASGGA